MLKMLAPITTRPPSWNTSAWTAITQAITSVAAHGPSRTAASTPPSRWPDVPPTTWKLNIWAAKMNAAVTPISGIARSSSVSLVLRTETASTTIVTSHIAPATGIVQEPVGRVHLGRQRGGVEAVADQRSEHASLQWMWRCRW